MRLLESFRAQMTQVNNEPAGGAGSSPAPATKKSGGKSVSGVVVERTVTAAVFQVTTDTLSKPGGEGGTNG